mgnify:CR=1 FL=1
MYLSPTQVTGQLCANIPVCGNGGDPEGSEECDDGNNQDSDGCAWDCTIEKCFGVVCEQPSNQCEEFSCDPLDGLCKVLGKLDGTVCHDNNACTQTDTCQAGRCTGGDEKQCPASECFEAGTCAPESGECVNKPIDKMGCNINLLDPAVARMADGTYMAIFGYESRAEKPFRPTENTVTPPLTESPYPPAYLLPGTHQGAFLPRLSEGQTITWKVDTDVKSVTADPATALTPVADGSGIYVNVGGAKVVIEPNLDAYARVPNDPAPEPEELPTGGPFKGTLQGNLTIGPSGAAIYTVPISIPPGIAGMAPNLSLVYNSQGGNGIAGQGWELTGLSTIYRCPKTLAEDGHGKPVQLGLDSASSISDDITSPDGDGICLDGKRLFLAPNPPSPPGIPPNPDAENIVRWRCPPAC